MSESAKELDLDFIADEEVRHVIGEYYRSAIAAYSAGSWLGAMVACGGVVEGLLSWGILRRDGQIERSQGKDIQWWGLEKLIKTGRRLDVIGQAAEDAAWAVKHFRDIIHPYGLLRGKMSIEPAPHLAESSLNAVAEVTASMSRRFSK